MLPKHHYSEKESKTFNDSEWIAGQIDLLPISIQKQVSDKYSDIYFRLSKEDPLKCRFRANSWLRKTVDKNKVVINKNDCSYF